METILYLTSSIVKLENIEKIALQVGYQTHLYSDNNPFLQIVFEKGSKKWCEWKITSEDDTFFESSKGLRNFQALKVMTMYDIEFGYASLPDLTKILKVVMEEYSGWVTDNIDFEELYFKDNIHTITKLLPINK